MAYSYSNALAATLGGDIVSAINGGTLEILDGSSTLLVSMALSGTAGTVSNKVLTFNTITHAPITTTGTAASAQIKDSGGTVQISGMTIGTSGTDIVVNTTTFVSGKDCDISSMTITQP